MNIRTAIEKILRDSCRSDGKPPFSADATFIARAKAAYRRNYESFWLENPGDCAFDKFLLLGLSIAEAHIGTGPGYIPEVQRYGVNYAEILENKV